MCVLRDQLEGKVITADLGGGTFDVSAIDFGQGVFQVVATMGDEKLGGDDFTSCVTNLILSKVEAEFDPAFLKSDQITSQRLLDAAEDAKKQLSSGDVGEVNIPYVRTRKGNYCTLSCNITRKQYEFVCQPLFDRIDTIVEKVCFRSGFRKDNAPAIPFPHVPSRQKKQHWIQKIFSSKSATPQKTQSSSSSPPPRAPIKSVVWLIGNASRVPEIRKRLESKYRMWHPPGVFDLKEPVVLGAAKLAGTGSSNTNITLPRSLMLAIQEQRRLSLLASSIE